MITDDCFDNLSQTKDLILPSFCFVALLPLKTIRAFKSIDKRKSSIEWNMIGLGINPTSFNITRRSVKKVLTEEQQAPFIGGVQSDRTRTSLS